MATDPKPGARNDLYALKEARRFNNAATDDIEQALKELQKMKEAVGRPNFEMLTTLLSQLSVNQSRIASNLNEMWLLREKSKQASAAEDQLRDRVESLERQLSQMNNVLELIRLNQHSMKGKTAHE